MSVGHQAKRKEDEEESDAPPPPDGGWGWMVVFASFMIHIISK
jgi:MCP family monocarboxylic acid transporter-like MFS transporter 14